MAYDLRIIINGEDFTDVISYEGCKETVVNFSPESETGRDLSETMHIPIISVKTQVEFEGHGGVTVERYSALAQAIKIHEKGEKHIPISFFSATRCRRVNIDAYNTSLTGVLAPVGNALYVHEIKFQFAEF